MNQNSKRVRIRTQPPLRPFQAWVAFNPTHTISQLKSTILSLLGNTQSIPLTSQDIRLELDAFAFLDQSLCELIDPAHDLIDVTTISPAPSASHIELSKKRRRSRGKSQLAPDICSEKEPTNPVERSKSQPAERAIKPLNHSRISGPDQLQKVKNIQPLSVSPSIQKVNVKDIPQAASPAPPGQGKPSTKARNQRKKLKRLREREQKQLAMGSLHQDRSKQIVAPSRDHKSNSPDLMKKPLPPQPSYGARNKRQANEADSSESEDSSSEDSDSETSSQQGDSSSDSSTESSSGSSTSSSESESEPATSVTKSTLSEASSQPSELPSKPARLPKTVTPIPQNIAPNTHKTVSNGYGNVPITQTTTTTIMQKTVPIVPNPDLNMLSLSNKNKRKNLKRKSGSQQLAQPTKIVFESDATGERPTSPLKSPCFMPPSPNCRTAPSSSSLAPASLPQPQTEYVEGHGHMPFEEEEEEEEEEETEYFDYSMTVPSHGPPPSARHPDLIPSNVLITSVNVLNPYWTPGQVGERWSSAHSTTRHHASGSGISKKTRKNRKKSLKRRRRLAAKNASLEQEQQEYGDDSEGSELDEEIRKDVEEAYAEFISSGGHSLADPGPAETELSDGGAFLKSLNEGWEELEKVDRKNAVLGSKVAIRTLELSVESFTPESMTYYGTLIGTNEGHMTLKLDAGCIPAAQSGLGLEEKEAAAEEQEWECQEEGLGMMEDGQEQLMVEVKEAIRAHQRYALALEVWGQCRDVRNWEWNSIIDARRL